MIAVVAKMKVQEGKESEFEQAMGELAAAVRDKEPGCKLYQLCKGQAAGQYVMIERYDDQQTLAAHSQTEHFKAGVAKFGKLLAGRPEIDFLTEV
jgi:quinol monooxygenase YgiN